MPTPTPQPPTHPLAAAIHWLRTIEALQQEDGAIGPRELHAQAQAITALTACIGLPHVSRLQLYRFDIAGVPKARPRSIPTAIPTGKTNSKGQPIFRGAMVHPDKFRVVNGEPVDRRGNKLTGARLNWYRSHVWYETVAHAVREGMQRQGITNKLTGHLGIDIEVHLPRPQRFTRKCDPVGPIPSMAKPDRDNLEKGVTDPMKEAGLWIDDSQLCCGPVRKFYHAIGASPGVIVHVWPLAPITQTTLKEITHAKVPISS